MIVDSGPVATDRRAGTSQRELGVLVAVASLATVCVSAASLLAIGLGVYGEADMIRVAIEGGHFEGYIALMGLILAGRGCCAFVHTMLSRLGVRCEQRP